MPLGIKLPFSFNKRQSEPPPMHFHTPFDLLSQKPVEKYDGTQEEKLPDVTTEEMAVGLEGLVENSAKHTDVSQGTHMHSKNIFEIPWLSKLIPGIEKLASQYHMGNFVVVRETGERIFESMPIYARIGMHLLFYGKEQVKLLEGNKRVETVLREQSIKQGKIYDDPASVESIASFAKTYSLNLDELLEPDITKYKTFNEFFYRKLKPGARPVQHPDDDLGVCSAADCRLTVYQTTEAAQKYWIKGDEFNLHSLLGVPAGSPTEQEFLGSSIAIFRLAPADYHRFHCPIDGTIEAEPHHIDGNYYTVNPQAVNEVNFDVFTANVREVVYITHSVTKKRVAFIAIGAMLVGAIRWTAGGGVGHHLKGKKVKKGDELGYFAYGGSTCIALFPKGTLEFDADLVKNSEEPVETLVKVGSSLGKVPKSAEKHGLVDKILHLGH